MNRSLAKAVRYAALPGIIPRVLELRLNTRYLAYLMALIFSIVRLLPPTHPYVSVVNMGRFGLRQVLGAASHNLKGGFRNIDQYIIFGGFLLGIVLLVLQFVLLFAAIAIHGANAAGYLSDFGSLFHTPHPASDVAFMMLDSVFQIPGFFNSMLGPPTDNDITFFARGLHQLFAFYSRGMLLVAVLIIMYYFFVVIVETAQTGDPFGERFDSIYVPIRLILALVLLVPTYHGLNSGQYLTLQVAKWGSSMATNAWLIHNNVILNNPYGVGTNNPLGFTTQEMVVYPKIEDIGSIVTFYQLASACRAAYKYQYSDIGDSNNPKDIQAYFVKPASSIGPSDSQPVASQSFSTMMTFFQGASFKIVFGEKNPTFYTKYDGNVKPYCGSMTLQIDAVDYDGARDLYETYYDYVLTLLWDDPDIIAYGDRTALIYFKERGGANGACGITPSRDWASPCAMSGSTCKCEQAGSGFNNDLKIDYQALFEVTMDSAITTVRASSPDQLKITNTILDLGWGGAGVWFNRLAEYNGAMVTAALKVPQPSAFPAVMEWVMRQKIKNQPGTISSDRFSPNLKEGDTVDDFWQQASLDVPAVDMGIAKFLDQTYRQLNAGDLTQDASTRLGKNPLVNVINSLFGLTGLYEMKRNVDVNPISRLAALGKGLIEKSITYLGGGLVMTGVGGIMGAFDKNFSQGLSALTGVVTGIGFSALTVGIVFFYIVPMMPFLYFFFALCRWVKGIFEAMVGVPLWALAHLKIDGEGIPAQAASNGYYLLLEIMIRPILTLFGLIVGFAIFTALVSGLDTIFSLVVSNVGGYNPYEADGVTLDASMVEAARSAVDEFVYTVFYCIIIYLIGTASFKLIDQLPNSILRFTGAGVASFGDQTPNLTNEMVGKIALGGTDKVGKIYEAGQQGVGAAGNLVGNVLKSMKDQGTGGKPGAARQEIDNIKKEATAAKMDNDSN